MKLSIKAVQPLMVFCTLAFFSLLSGCRAASLTLVQDGQPRAEIVISEQPERTVRLAAQQLQDYVVKISGAKLPIVTKPSGQAIKVFVGRSSYTDDLKVTAEGLEDGAYRIASGDDWIVLIGKDTNFTPVEPWAHRNSDIPRAQSDWDKITGAHWGLPAWSTQLRKGLLELPGSTGKPEGATTKKGEVLSLWQYDERGSFNAVIDLLMKLGVRWYMPGEKGEVVPEMKTIALPQRNETVRPDFPLRHLQMTFSRGHDAAMWYMHQRTSNPYGKVSTHGMEDMTENATVREAHPDWFALYGGKRNNQPGIGKNYQLCFSNEELFQATVRYVRAQFDHYDYDIVSIMPPDGYTTICQCPLCAGKDDPERGSRGHLSNYVWDFVNRVAKEIEKTNPGKKVRCEAYGGYRLPPTNIAKLEPNVLVRISGGRRPTADKPEEREALRQLRQEWQAKTDNPIFILENYPLTNRGWYLPAFQPHLLGESINEIKGSVGGEVIWFSQRNDFTFTTPNMGFNHFMLYFTANMYWGGKNADVDAMFREYCRLFYGPAAQEMQEFFNYCEANWREMDKDKTKADQALALFAKAKSKADASSIYGGRIARIDDFLEGLRNKSQQMGKARGPVPTLRLTQKAGNMKDVVIDGKLDDAGWQNFPLASTGNLREIETGQAPAFGTTFKAGWGNGSVYFAIRCEDRPGEKPHIGATKKDDPTMWFGDCIEIELETESHSYYQIAVSPDGIIADLDRSGGKKFDWDSTVEVATHIGDGYWTVEIRIPVTADENDPLHQVIGHKPTLGLPWFFNLYRQRVRENGTENSAFSPTGGSFHNGALLKFAYFYDGSLHKFESEPDDDYLHDISSGDYAKAAARAKISDRQKSYALELAAAQERKAKKWDAADKITAQIPIEAVQKTVQMENLFAQGKATEIIQKFGSEEISAWPFWKRGDGYFIRGRAYAATGAGKEAVADFTRALEFTSDWRACEEINLELGQVYERLLKDDIAALAAYRAVYDAGDRINGSTQRQAVQDAARILTRQGKFDEALKELDRIDTKKVSGRWRDSTLLARGAALEAAGRKTEAAAIYQGMLADKSTQPGFRKDAEAALQKVK